MTEFDEDLDIEMIGWILNWFMKNSMSDWSYINGSRLSLISRYETSPTLATFHMPGLYQFW